MAEVHGKLQPLQANVLMMLDYLQRIEAIRGAGRLYIP